jgi:hypothetical protein
MRSALIVPEALEEVKRKQRDGEKILDSSGPGCDPYPT